MSNELRTIFVEGREVDVHGTKILIKSISVGNIPLVIGIANKFFSIAKDAKSDGKYNDAIVTLIKEDFAIVLKLIEITTNIDEADIPKLNISALTIILAEVIKENADFFTLYVLPNLQSLFLIMKKQDQPKSGSPKSKS